MGEITPKKQKNKSARIELIQPVAVNGIGIKVECEGSKFVLVYVLKSDGIWTVFVL